MRIISGKFKGKKIQDPINKETRPLKDLTKESIFNIISHTNLFNIDIEKSNILDLFSGVGSFGLECISRGASHVDFFENYSGALGILKKNIATLDCVNSTKIWEKDAFNEKNFIDLKKKYEIIFLDPPYKEKNLPNLLNKINQLNLLKKNGVVITHRHKNEKENFPDTFNILIERTYGISKIIFGN